LQRVREVEQLPSIALFWGERDRVIPIRHGEALCALLENCTLWRLPGAGHFLHWQAPRELASAVLAYLDGPWLGPSRFKEFALERELAGAYPRAGDAGGGASVPR
jgi:hypothetical protein